MVGVTSEDDIAVAVRQAAIEVEEYFDDHSKFRDDSRAAMAASFGPEELLLGPKKSLFDRISKNGGVFSVYALRGISLGNTDRGPPFGEVAEQCRARFAGRSHEGHYAVKFVDPHALQTDPRSAVDAASSLVAEAKILMNLEKHPHVSRIYGIHVRGPGAGFANNPIEQNFFLIADAISETLPDRIRAWRKGEAYEGERLDDLEVRQSKVTQRLEIALDIVSALTFLSKRNLVYFLHPEKVGFDSRMKRIKLFDFGHAQESGKSPYFFFEENNMVRRVYLAPEVLRREKIALDADVFAVGMLLWEILILKPPLYGMKRDQHMKDVANGKRRPYLSTTLPKGVKQLIEDCWAPNSRPTVKVVNDKLEELLLEGIELPLTVDDIQRPMPRSRRIKYNKDGNEAIVDGDPESTSTISKGASANFKVSRRSKDSSSQSKRLNTLSHDRPKRSLSRSKKNQYQHEVASPNEGRTRPRERSKSQETRRSRDLNENEPLSKALSRRIKYEKVETKMLDVWDPDVKSTRSRESQRSKKSSGSGEASSRRSQSSRNVNSGEDEKDSYRRSASTKLVSSISRSNSISGEGGTISRAECSVNGHMSDIAEVGFSCVRGRDRQANRSSSSLTPSSRGRSEERSVISERRLKSSSSRRLHLRQSLSQKDLCRDNTAAMKFVTPRGISRRSLLSFLRSEESIFVDWCDKKSTDSGTDIKPSRSQSLRIVGSALSPSLTNKNANSDVSTPRLTRRMSGVAEDVILGDPSRQGHVRSRSNDIAYLSKTTSESRQSELLNGRKSAETIGLENMAIGRAQVVREALANRRSGRSKKDDNDDKEFDENLFSVVTSRSDQRFGRSRRDSARELGALPDLKSQPPESCISPDDVDWGTFGVRARVDVDRPQFSEIESETDRNRRGRLKTRPSNGGLIKASSRDTSEGSRTRSKMRNDKKEHSIHRHGVAESLRERQRRTEHSKSLGAAVIVGSRRDLLLQRQTQPKRSLSNVDIKLKTTP